MSRRIYEALAGMEPGDGAPASEPQSLMPPRHPLELSVTVTDYYGYARHLPIADPPVVAEAQHRHLLEFRYRSDQRNDFTAKQNGALTLAARATSSLPVGFQPVHVRHVSGCAAEGRHDVRGDRALLPRVPRSPAPSPAGPTSSTAACSTTSRSVLCFARSSSAPRRTRSIATCIFLEPDPKAPDEALTEEPQDSEADPARSWER